MIQRQIIVNSHYEFLINHKQIYQLQHKRKNSSEILMKKVDKIIKLSLTHLRKYPTFAFCSSHKIENLNKTQIQQLAATYHSKPIFTVFQPYIRNKVLDHFQVFNIAKKEPFSLSFYDSFKQYLDSVSERNDNYYLLKGKVVSEIGSYFLNKNQLQKAKQKLLEALQIMQESVVPPIIPYHRVYRSYGIALYMNKQFEQAKQILIECTTIIAKFTGQSQDKVSQKSLDQASAYTYLIILDTQNQRQWVELARKAWDQVQDQKFQSKVYAEFLIKQLKSLKKQNKLKEAQRLFRRETSLIQNQQIRQMIESAFKDESP